MRRMIRNALSRIKSKFTEDLDKDVGHYWQMSADNGRIQDQSHWCGAGRWSRERWLTYGDFHFALSSQWIDKYAEQGYAHQLRDKTALEWGSGGGANIRPLCRKFSFVYGVDVSEASLDECERRMRELGLHNFRKIPFPSHDPESVLGHIAPDSIDFILSVGVFKHFPSKAYTQRVLHTMEKMLRKNAHALIQIRYDDGTGKFRQKDGDNARNVITMTSFTSEDFKDQLRTCRLKVLHVQRDVENDHENHEYYFLEKSLCSEGHGE